MHEIVPVLHSLTKLLFSIQSQSREPPDAFIWPTANKTIQKADLSSNACITDSNRYSYSWHTEKVPSHALNIQSNNICQLKIKMFGYTSFYLENRHSEQILGFSLRILWLSDSHEANFGISNLLSRVEWVSIRVFWSNYSGDVASKTIRKLGERSVCPNFKELIESQYGNVSFFPTTMLDMIIFSTFLV